MLINNKNIGYSKEKNVLGAIVGVDLIENTVKLIDENEVVHTVDMEDVLELREAGSIEDAYLYEGDVLKVTDTGKTYELLVEEDGTLAMHLLDKKLERVEKGKGLSFAPKQLSSFAGVLEFVGNIHELKANKKTVDFNLAVFRKFVDNEVSYFYAGNDKDKEEVDLIKVLFVGHQILEEEEYERTTFSHEQFLEMVESGLLKEVNPMEVANYVAGKIHGQSATAPKKDVPTVETQIYMDSLVSADEDEDEEELCDECGFPLEDCDCNLW